jgi:hypothetical protein
MPRRYFPAFLLVVAIPTAAFAQVGPSSPSAAAAALIRAYPDFLDRMEDNDLVWKDGTRMRIDDGKGAKAFDALLDDPDIKDMFLMKYPLGRQGLAPALNFDPGRVRYAPLYKKMYGDCRTGDVSANMVDVIWLPSRYGKSLKFSRINGAAAALGRVSDEVDKLPQRFLAYVRPTQGTYNCRLVAGTNRESTHGLGIAIDIADGRSPTPMAAFPTRTRFPGRSSRFSRSTASSGVASGITTTQCISSTGRKSSFPKTRTCTHK